MEEVTNRYGRVCYIKERGDSTRVLVAFKDSNIEKYANIERFRAGLISDKVKATQDSPANIVHLGEKRRQGDYWAELIEWDSNVRCKFKISELDVTIYGTYKDFYDGALLPVEGMDIKCTVEQKFGLKASVEYVKNKKIGVRFENGVYVNTDYDTFLTGQVLLPGFEFVKAGIYTYGGRRVIDVDLSEGEVTINFGDEVVKYA